MQLHFNAISEPTLPGPKWQKLFNTYWAGYRTWFESKGAANNPDLQTSQAALQKYMPEMVPTYERLCKLVNADKVAARLLTGFQPPAYISACSQGVKTEGKIQLVRNYDYHPDLLEGTLLMSAWNGKKVIANIDCLIGVLDGINEDGLVISLTFGGRKQVGVGFGIPFILRYVLEFCSNVEEAVAALVRIPSHMSYNVTVVDKTGAMKTVRLAPDRAPVVTDAAFTTNHQGTVDWPENAQFNKTVERSAFLENLLSAKELAAEAMVNSFLNTPLYNTRFSEGFGTLYTAVYHPTEGSMQVRWPNNSMTQSFDNFREEYQLINFNQTAASTPYYTPDPKWSQIPAEATKWTQMPAEAAKWINEGTKTQEVPQAGFTEAFADTLVDAIAKVAPAEDKKELEALREKMILRGEISWEILADYWSNVGKSYAEKWTK